MHAGHYISSKEMRIADCGMGNPQPEVRHSEFSGIASHPAALPDLLLWSDPGRSSSNRRPAAADRAEVAARSLHHRSDQGSRTMEEDAGNGGNEGR